MSTQPWAAGPKEILEHGASLLRKDSDRNRRLALLSIDNAVELTIKTYLGLPKRINGINIPRKEYVEFSESFAKLLDALEQYASSKISGINLGDIEWYHRLRNQLYHQGNGLTVDRDKVEVYSEIAKLLFESLFEAKLEFPTEDQHQLLGEFLASWVVFEREFSILSKMHTEIKRPESLHFTVPLSTVKILVNAGHFTEADAKEIDELRKIRNEVVHGIVDYKSVITRELIKRLESLTSRCKTVVESANRTTHA